MVHRQAVLKSLELYRSNWVDNHVSYPGSIVGEELPTITEFIAFTQANVDCFHRANSRGHYTGSALVTSPQFDKVLLTLHGKLNLWLQLGGHADGNANLMEVAAQEAQEESGLDNLQMDDFRDVFGYEQGLPRQPFDIDRHLIPANSREPAHMHYDMRYLMIADPLATLTITSESRDLRWFSLDEAKRITSERSMHRQFAKLEFLACRRHEHNRQP